MDEHPVMGLGWFSQSDWTQTISENPSPEEVWQGTTEVAIPPETQQNAAWSLYSWDMLGH